MSLSAATVDMPPTSAIIPSVGGILRSIEREEELQGSNICRIESSPTPSRIGYEYKSSPEAEELRTYVSTSPPIILPTAPEGAIRIQHRAGPGWRAKALRIASLMYDLAKKHICLSCNKTMRVQGCFNQHVFHHFVMYACACGEVRRYRGNAAKHWKNCPIGQCNGFIYEFDYASADALATELGTNLHLPKPWPPINEDALYTLLDEQKRKTGAESSMKSKPIKECPEPSIYGVSDAVYPPPIPVSERSLIDNHIREYSVQELKKAAQVLQITNDQLSKCLEQNQIALAVVKAKISLAQSPPNGLHARKSPPTTNETNGN